MSLRCRVELSCKIWHKSVNPFWLGIGEVSVSFLTSTQSDRQSINQTFFVSCTDHKYRNIEICWASGVQNTWSHAQMFLLGVTTFKFNIFPYFSKKYVKIRAKRSNFKQKWWNMIVEVYQKVWSRSMSKFNTVSRALNSVFLHNMMTSQ